MAYLGPSLKREKRKERPVRRTLLAALASLALNVVLLEVLGASGAFSFKAPPEKTRVTMAPLSASQWESNRAVGGARPPPAVAPPRAQPPPPQNDRMDGQVVELSPDQKAADKPPPNARFLSDRNAKTEKETVSRFAGNYPRLAPRPEAGAQGKAQPAPPPPKPPAQRDVQPGGKDAGAPGREGAPGDRVALAKPGGALRLPELGEGGQRGRRGEAGPDLTVSREAMARIAGGPNMDGVREGLPEGDETSLNAREFKYATFMNRMRSVIGQQWYPRVRDAYQARDPDGRLYFYKERTVVLGLTIDTDGKVKDLQVLESSNIEFFDRVAMSSVQAAQPFPNPPRGMFHEDQQVRIPFRFTMFPGDRHGLLFWRPPAE
jgi:TonB family protein